MRGVGRLWFDVDGQVGARRVGGIAMLAARGQRAIRAAQHTPREPFEHERRQQRGQQ
ncbi:hypothetical protein ABIE53_005892 [Burkholderia sp. OAS925]